MIDIGPELVYDDITLFSREISTIKSRFDKDIKLTTEVNFDGDKENIGIIFSSPMLDVSGLDMCAFLNFEGHTGVLHRFMSLDDQAFEIMSVIDCIGDSNNPIISFSVGIHDSKDKLDLLLELLSNSSTWFHDFGKFIICIDTANGSSELLLPTIENIKEFKKSLSIISDIKVEIMAGNIVTKEAAEFLVNNGVKFLRVGIGGGSVCTTPLATGMFRPVVSAIIEIDAWREESEKEFYIVADGGIKGAGDAMKAIAVGADFIMLGSLLSGFDESNGDVFFDGGVSYKLYRGMASYDMASLNNKVNGLNKKIIPEGVSARVPYKGSIDNFWGEFIGSMKSSMSYANARNLKEFRNNIEIVKCSVNTNSLREPHGLKRF